MIMSRRIETFNLSPKKWLQQIEKLIPEVEEAHFRYDKRTLVLYSEGIFLFCLSLVPGCQVLLVSHNMIVEPEFRGRGIATKLQIVKERIAKELRATALLATVRSDNTPQQKIMGKIDAWEKIKTMENPNTKDKFEIWAKDIESLVEEEEEIEIERKKETQEKKKELRLLILGGTGTVGGGFVRYCKENNIKYYAPNRATINVNANIDLWKGIHKSKFKPTHVINCAAMTNIYELDKFDVNKRMGFETNVTVVHNLCLLCKEKNIGYVQFGTDYLHYKTHDYYTLTKRIAYNIWEYFSKQVNLPWMWVNMHWVFGPSKNENDFLARNFKKIQRGEIPEFPSYFEHQIGTPCYNLDLAERIILTLQDGRKMPNITGPGIYRKHFWMAACKKFGHLGTYALNTTKTEMVPPLMLNKESNEGNNKENYIKRLINQLTDYAERKPNLRGSHV